MVHKGESIMFKRRLRRRAENDPQAPTLGVSQDALPADVLAWAQVVDVSQLPERTMREAEYYLKNYRWMPLGDTQEMAWRLVSVIHSYVNPPPPLDAQPRDVLAIVLAARRRELGIG
jgi:hypothetical protein